MTSRVTQCPNCQTSFRVTDAQLEIASGAVRCGSCLHIFNAPDHWLGETPLAPTTQAPEPEPTPQYEDEDEHEEELRFDDEMGLDSDSPDTEPSTFINELNDWEQPSLADEQTTAQPLDIDDEFALSEDSFNAAFESADSDIGDTASSNFDDNIHIELDDDEELLFQDTSQQEVASDSAIATAEETIDLSNSFLNLSPTEPGENPVFKDLDDLGGMDESSDDDWVSQLLEDDDPESHEKPDEEAVDIPHFDDLLDDLPSNEPRPAADEEIDPELLDINAKPPTPAEEEEFVLDGQPLTAGDRIGDTPGVLGNFEPDPLELAAPQQQRNWPLLGWSLAALLTLLGLAGQALYFNFEQLARDPAWRPVLSKSCTLIGCKMPELHDIGRIKLNNLIVRSHPGIANALVVDAIISNRAPFQQHFPDLELRFSDIEGTTVASRRFNPSEYLAGELSGMTSMPVNQPIHIALEIVDPGKNALNYQLLAVPPRQP